MKNNLKLGIALAASIPSLALASQKPNLIIIMTDEHNFRTLSCYRDNLPEDQANVWGAEAAKIMTPNLDRIAEMGALMQNFNAVQPVSSPSRGAFFTGLYPQKNGVTKNDVFMNEDARTIGDELRDAGYSTGYCGKLHLYGDSKPGWQPKRDFGFTDNRYMFNRGHWKVLKVGAQGEGVVLDMEKSARKDMNEDTFTTDFLTNRTIEFIDKNYDKPFCYVLNIPDPHDPNSVREPYASMYNDVKFEMPATSSAPHGDLNWQTPTKNLAFNKPNHYFARYFGMVKCIDDNIGRLFTKLEEKGILDNTIIVFTADHGDMMGEHSRDNKGTPYYSSAKVPMLVYYKGKIKAESVIESTMGSVDFVPTMLSLMGVKGKQEADGRDCSELLTKGKLPKGYKDIVISKMGGWVAAITPEYKLIFTSAKEALPPVLFDVKRDPNEVKDFYGKAGYEAVTKELAQYLLAYMKEHKDPLLKSSSVMDSMEKAAK